MIVDVVATKTTGYRKNKKLRDKAFTSPISLFFFKKFIIMDVTSWINVYNLFYNCQ